MEIHFGRLPLWAAFCGVLMLSAMGARASDLPSTLAQGAIKTVIIRQLGAFSRHDAGAAYSLASPMIQQLFKSPENFIAMVRSGYPQVYRHRRAEFGDLILLGGELAQPVIFTGTDGHRVLAVYAMVKDAAGAWRINGCRLLQKGALAA
ncbi:MAG: DUF4864 domain-containing protein [Proteobacteria bacterium]|nr:DUF4864 domain-containing protein [Pseudomonadota bacterium]